MAEVYIDEATAYEDLIANKKKVMEIITKEGEKINRYTPSEDNSDSGNKGKRVGTAYELENGDIIYVPE